MSIPAPLFRDPVHDGAADPTLVWNQEEQCWWIFYTNRRANMPGPGVSWGHGTDLGMASTPDRGRTWHYRGIAAGLEIELGQHTFWAPEIIRHEGVYHMFVSYVQGVPFTWSGERHILHFTSRDLLAWSFQSQLKLSSRHVIDACVIRLPDSRWRMWYKDEAAGSHTWFADSEDLFTWQPHGCAIGGEPHEGPNVFFWQERFWMIVDTWAGQAVYESPDATQWKRHGLILDQPGHRPDDGDFGRHADVLVNGANAFVFYFTHPERNPADNFGEKDEWPFAAKRTSLQVAQFEWGEERLTCDRDKVFDLVLESQW